MLIRLCKPLAEGEIESIRALVRLGGRPWGVGTPLAAKGAA